MTESETVGASDCLGQTIWTMNFLKHQGIHTRRRYCYQDNDRIKRGDIHLLYCPTADIVADFYSKPQQGSLYKRFCDMVMGMTPVPPVEDPSFTCPTSQERVGSSIFGAGGQRTDGENMTKMARPTVTWADRVRGFAGGIARPELLGPAHEKLVNR
ncbi:unnamed protein product [Cylindrotheca closterium]|uniref:Uncharacterized protein n=1 Tax=Cylindrotheca closterium TaxID=2856 RepID=A0AAD2FRH8_9STRA|nr:unnamed protein product [Cylindrotheca closterium]CAJ1950466.1 unnamed protein product [Cylindrotheca closterium]CAJ1950468.1 unnamed protein product [Cylindrotheca closterium]CAJ1950470.1 unnamed protein product [Cylindrotheca closterium]